jgi:CubicO group peptidase (beta-lactamase class C family)
VVDLWGGIRNEATGEPWEEDTMVIVYSTTKGLSALAMALAQSRGLFDYDESVASYWPEFAQHGKGAITIRQLLAHQAGLFAFDELGNRSIVANLDRLAVVLARQKPAHEPGMRQVYHAVSLGYYEGELLRRVDPKGRSIGQYFRDEIAAPLGLDFHIRLPDEIPNSRLATPRPARIGLSTMLTMPLPLLLACCSRQSIRGPPSAEPWGDRCFPWTHSASTHGISRFRPEAVWARRAPSPAHTASFRRAGKSSG